MICVLDYGCGNAASIVNMIRRSGFQAELCSSAGELEASTAIILPGVGSFDNGVQKLSDSGLRPVLERRVLVDKVPFLGVCLGMQLLFERSAEGAQLGLGWLRGEVLRFDFPKDSNVQALKVPHMGWNIVKPRVFEREFLNFDDEARFYFVHSFFVRCEDPEDILATATYGREFTCAVRRGNVCGVQFHPEKSHKFGLKFFKNFLTEVNIA